MKEIPLTRGRVAIVDDIDYERMSIFKWSVSCKGSRCYAIRCKLIAPGKYKMVKMHREILGLSDPKDKVDHINMDGLFNVRSNLRVCSQSENMMNRNVQKNSTSGIKGVSWCKNSLKWRAIIKINGVQKFIGRFDCKIEAGKAYDKAASDLFGEYARKNF